jgi:hypothetical protein
MGKLKEMGIPDDATDQLGNSFEKAQEMPIDQFMQMVGMALGQVMEMMSKMNKQAETMGMDPEMMQKAMTFIDSLKNRFEEGEFEEFDIQEAIEGLKPELKEFGMEQEDFERLREMVKDVSGDNMGREFLTKISSLIQMKLMGLEKDPSTPEGAADLMVKNMIKQMQAQLGKDLDFENKDMLMNAMRGVFGSMGMPEEFMSQIMDRMRGVGDWEEFGNRFAQIYMEMSK